jgi:cytochrome c oxidase subunit 1
MVWAVLAIGCLSFVVWAHHMYVSGMNPYFGFFFATTTLIIAVPTAIKVYNWVLTLWRGDIHLTVPMMFAIGFIFTFINGGLTGLFLGNVTVDVPLSATYFVVAHFHLVMGVSPILVVFGAIYHWYPKMTGRMLNDTLGRIHFWLTFIGTYAIYLPMYYLGILGLPRLHRRGGAADIPVQPALVAARRQAGRRQSLARDDARVADARHTAEARQLGRQAAGRVPLGLRLQRAGRPRGFHAAERAAGPGPRHARTQFPRMSRRR